MLGIVLIAAALGLSNFGASIAIGLTGVDRGTRRDVILTFGFFEAAMPVVGLLLGRRMATVFGSGSSYIGGGILIIAGIYSFVGARRESSAPSPRSNRRGSLILMGAALSIDNLVVGFALGAYKVSLVLAVVVIAAVSVGMSLIGLEVGGRLGVAVERWSAEIAAAILVIVGAAIATGLL